MRRQGPVVVARRHLVAGLLVALVAPAGPWAAGARAGASGEQYALLVEGASGTPEYAALHRRWLDEMAGVLRDKFKYDPAHLVVLAEQPQEGEERATADGVRAALTRLAAELEADDQLFIMLIGHGTGNAAEAKFNLVGPDLTVSEWGALLKPIAGRMAFVDTTSSSFPFLAGLAAPGRVVITATASYAQLYHTVFPEGFVKAFSTEAADLDKNGRISLLEAFTYASHEAARVYEQNGTKATERAMFSDTGNNAGQDASGTGPDGTVAGLTYLDAVAVPTSSDPAMQDLLTRQQELTRQVDELRRRRLMMSANDFDQEFERLIIELSLVSRDVRRRAGGGPF
jgi:hypothetical protein